MCCVAVASFLSQVLSVSYPRKRSYRPLPNLVLSIGFAVMVVRFPGIEASIPRVTNQAALTVVAPPLLEVGQRVTLRAEIKDRAAGSRPEHVTWTSSDTGVAKVTSDGVVSALGVGQVTLTAAIGSVTGSTVVQVLLPLDVGGSNYVMYSVWSYLENPTQKTWFTPGVMRPVIGAYHLDSATVKRQLASMYANGQRSIALLLWYGDFSSDSRISDSLLYGHLVNAKLGHLMPRHVANLQRVLTLIRETGYRHLVFRFDGQGPSRSREWKTWDEAKYQLNWRFLTSTQAIVDSVLSGSNIAILYDLDAEATGVEVGQQRAYAVRLWRDYTALFGTQRTIGFSIAVIPGRLTKGIADYDRVGSRPREYALDIYGDELRTLTYVRNELLSAGSDELKKPIIILEDFYDDAQSAKEILQARSQLMLNIRTVLQWPLARGARQAHFSIDYPADYSAYLDLNSR